VSTPRKDATWRELSLAGIIPDAGNAREYETGSWRTMRPIRDNEACTNCLQCWAYCPDVAMLCIEGNVKGSPIDYRYCKGCGICADVCPVDCIEMVVEGEASDEQRDAAIAAAKEARS